MVIGYGFRDDHINEIISDAVTNHNLKLFVMSPDGADQARKIAPTAGAALQHRTALEDVFQRGLSVRRTVQFNHPPICALKPASTAGPRYPPSRLAIFPESGRAEAGDGDLLEQVRAGYDG